MSKASLFPSDACSGSSPRRQGPKACFLPRWLDLGHFLFVHTERKHAFCRACLVGVILFRQHGTKACFLLSMLVQVHSLSLTRSQGMLSAKNGCSRSFPFANKQLKHVFCQVNLCRFIPSCKHGAKACFLPNMFVQGHSLSPTRSQGILSAKHNCSGSFPRLQGAMTCSLPSWLSPGHFLLSTGNKSMLSVKHAYSGSFSLADTEL